jgi:hypothetical protein
MAKPASTAIDGLPAFYKSGDLNVIIETPKGDEDQRGAFLMVSDPTEVSRSRRVRASCSGLSPVLYLRS